MVIRIGGPRVEMPQALETEQVEAPPPPPPVAPPKGYSDDSNFNAQPVAATPTGSSDGFSGKLDVQFEYQGQTQPIQLTASNGALSLDGKEVGRITGTKADGSFALELLGKPAVGTRNVPTSVAGQAQLGDMKPFPGGAPETYVKPLYGGEVNLLEADRQQMIDTVVSAIPTEKQAEVRTLLETGGPELAKLPIPIGQEFISAGIREDSLRNAFNQVLEARKSPGTKTLNLELTAQRAILGPDMSSGESGSNVRGTVLEDGTPLKLSFKVQVDSKGAVNGAALPIDEISRLRTELTKVPPELKEEALKRAGFDGEWLQRADRDQRDVLLAKLRQATLTPGEHTIDVGYDETLSQGSEGSGPDTKRHIDGKVTFTVDEKGNVNGKPLFIETSLATTRVMEQLPMAEKKAMLERLGFKPEDLKPLSADRATEILTRVSMKTLEPGQHSLEVDTGADKFAIALKVSDKGELEGAGVTKLPPPPKKKSLFSRIIGPVLSVVGFVFPPALPFIQIAQAGLAIANGAKGLSLVGAVLGGAAGVADVAGAASLAGSLSSAAGVVNSVNGTINGIKNGDYLGAFSSAVSLASATGSVAQGSVLANLGTLASAGSAIRSGDAGGLFSIALNAFKAQTGGSAQTSSTSGAATGTTASDADGPEQLSGPGAPSDSAPEDGPVQLSGPGAPSTPVTDDEGPVQLSGPTDSDEPEQLSGPTGPDATDGTNGVAPTDPAPVADESVTVKKGDTLTGLAKKYLDKSSDWPRLYEYNKELFPNGPNSLQPGVELKIPPPDFEVSPQRRAELYGEAYIAPKPAQTQPDPDPDNDVGVKEDLGTDYGPNDPRPDVPSPQLRPLSAPEQSKLVEFAGQVADALKDPEVLKKLKDTTAVANGAADFLSAVEHAKATGNYAEVAEFFAKPTAREAFNELVEAAPSKFKLLGKFLDVAGPALAAVEASHDHTNVTTAGYRANVVAQTFVDVLVGKSNPVVAGLDAFLSLAGSLTPKDAPVDLSVSKNLGGGVQSVIAILESLTVEDKASVLEAIRAKNASGQNGFIIQGYANLGELASGPINDLIFSFKADPLVQAEQARIQKLQRANIRRQQSG